MKEYKHYINGKYVNEEELLISPRDFGFRVHLDACFHLIIQPKGKTASGEAIDRLEFDIRGLKGDKIPLLSRMQLTEMNRKTPSPCGGIPKRK